MFRRAAHRAFRQHVRSATVTGCAIGAIGAFMSRNIQADAIDDGPSARDVRTGPSRKLRVGVLGATGTVGQRFLQLLDDHPWFQAVALGASKRSAGKAYSDAAAWQLSGDAPQRHQREIVLACDPEVFRQQGVDFVFSALDAGPAGPIEASFVRAGIPVFSNARSYRQHPAVPLVVPPVNGDHLRMAEAQARASAPRTGFIVTNANCSTTGMVIALRPLQRTFGLRSVVCTTMQAISGAGYPGLSGMDMIDNLVPHIGGEEEKLEREYRKILGRLPSEAEAEVAAGGAVEDAGKAKAGAEAWVGLPEVEEALFPLSAQANRVHVLDGHTICLSLVLEREARPSEVKAALESYVPEDREWPVIPSAPARILRVREEKDRPQPRKDRDEGAGLTTVVGRVRPDPVMESLVLGGPVVPVAEGDEDAPRRAFKMVVCSHNTVMGAAGSSLLNAELATAKGVLLTREEAEARGQKWLEEAVGRYVKQQAAERETKSGAGKAAKAKAKAADEEAA